MSHYEIFSAILSSMSIIIALFAFASARSAAKSASASIEFSTYNAITSAKKQIMDCSESMELLLVKDQLSADEKKLLDIRKERFNVAIENYLNSYQEGCAKYRDNKIDRTRFRKTYFFEIQKIVENKNYKEYFNPVTSKYKDILKVYDEWFYQEK